MEILLVVALTGVIAAIAVPMMSNTLGDFRLRGDARGLTNAVSMAKLRAASDFSNVRLYVDLSTQSFHIETYQKTPAAWVTEGGATQLQGTDRFSYGSVGSAPANTQGAILQASPCLTIAGIAIASTACIIFNSRGIPVDSTNAPTGTYALYITDSTAVYGVEVSATGLITLWRTGPTATPSWVLQ